VYAFVHIFKTAGTTLTAILRRNFGVRHFDDRILGQDRLLTAADMRRLLRVSPFLASIAGHQTRPFSDLHEAVPDIHYYTFLRDPFQRTLSGFQFVMFTEGKRGRHLTTTGQIRATFVAHVRHFSNWQTRHLADVADAEAAIKMIQTRIPFVGLVERFDESLVMLRKWMGKADLNIAYTPLNVSAKRHLESRSRAAKPEKLRPVSDFLRQVPEDPELNEMVREANREDQKLYDHVTSSAYPTLRQWYGAALDCDLARFQEMQEQTTIGFNDSLAGKTYRNLVIKPLKPWLFPKAA